MPNPTAVAETDNAGIPNSGATLSRAPGEGPGEGLGESPADQALEASLIQELTVHLETQLKLCTALEKIADDLPDKVCRQSCLHAARSIYPIIKSAHQFEEERLFPALQSALEARPASAGNPIQRLMEEHWEDESFGQEIADVMREFVAGRDANTDKLGYMLRGFFDGLRRHIAFERELLGPLLGVMES